MQPVPECYAYLCFFLFHQRPGMKQRVGLWMAKPFQFLLLPPQVPNQALSCSYLVDFSGSAVSGQGLHRFKVIFITAQLQVILKHPTKKAECFSHQKVYFLNHRQIHLEMRIKYCSYSPTAAIVLKVQREPRFFQLIRYLNFYIYVVLCISLPSTFL